MKKIIFIVCAVFAFPQSLSIAHAEDLPPLRFETYEDYGHYLVVNTWDETEWESFKEIIYRESKWNHTAKNPKSSAYGLCQTMMSLHETPESFIEDGFVQLDWCVNYVQERYGTPKKALLFHEVNNWF